MIATRRETPTQSKERRLLKMRDVAKMLCCSEGKVRSMVWSGVLPFVSIGRLHLIELADVERYIDAHKTVNASPIL